jgi:hypothetical protein
MLKNIEEKQKQIRRERNMREFQENSVSVQPTVEIVEKIQPAASIRFTSTPKAPRHPPPWSTEISSEISASHSVPIKSTSFSSPIAVRTINASPKKSPGNFLDKELENYEKYLEQKIESLTKPTNSSKSRDPVKNSPLPSIFGNDHSFNTFTTEYRSKFRNFTEKSPEKPKQTFHRIEDEEEENCIINKDENKNFLEDQEPGNLEEYFEKIPQNSPPNKNVTSPIREYENRIERNIQKQNQLWSQLEDKKSRDSIIQSRDSIIQSRDSIIQSRDSIIQSRDGRRIRRGRIKS